MQYIAVSERTHSTYEEARAGKEENTLFELGGDGSNRGNRKRGKK